MSLYSSNRDKGISPLLALGCGPPWEAPLQGTLSSWSGGIKGNQLPLSPGDPSITCLISLHPLFRTCALFQSHHLLRTHSSLSIEKTWGLHYSSAPAPTFAAHNFEENLDSWLGLCCCVWAFSSCGKRGLFFIEVCGLLIVMASSCCGPQASAIVVHALSARQAACRIFWTRDGSYVPLHWQRVGGIRKQWTTR